MMNRTFPAKILGFALLTVLLLVSQGLAGEKSTVVKIATLAPDGSTWVKGFNQLNAEVMKKTENRVQFKIYAGGILGDERDMLRKLKIGQIQGAALTSAGLSSIFNEIDVLQIPFLFQTYEEVDAVLAKTDTFFRKGLEARGYVLLGWSEGGFLYLLSNTPIQTVADFKKAKVWIWEESSMPKAVMDEAGVSAIPLSVPDVLVALQTGMVDTVYAPPTGAIVLQWFTRVKYMTHVPLVYLAGGIIVSKETFNKIPPATQNTILQSFEATAAQLKKATRKENEEAIKVMTKHGVKMLTPSRDQIEEFKKLSQRAMTRYQASQSQSFSKKVLDEVSSILDTYRKGQKP
jgi:TRAP-type C4-dicarboxylate transport system substrate-binding protein